MHALVVTGSKGHAKGAAVVLGGVGNIAIPPGSPYKVHIRGSVLGRRAGRGSKRRSFTVHVDEVLELLTGLEEGNALRRNFHLGAGFGIAPYAAATLARAKT